MADLDSDGDQDLVLASMEGSSPILLNDGNGYFNKSAQTLPNNMHDIAIGDVDNDGDKDLFFAPIRPNLPCPVFLNDGQGVFNRSTTPSTLVPSERVHLFDIENDGDLDAFLLWRNLLYLNDGSGNFVKSNTTLPGIPTFSDLNSDDYVDIISWKGERGFTVYLNDKFGNFVQFSFLQMSSLIICEIDITDIDNDGDNDVIFSNGEEEKKLPSGILLNDGSGRFTDSGQQLSSVGFGYCGTGDLNNDGYIDILVADRSGPANVWINKGNGEFLDSNIKLGDNGGWNNCIIKDIDNDGDLDIFITNIFSQNHGLWFNQLIE